MKRRNYNLELCLFPTNHPIVEEEEDHSDQSPIQNKQPLTIFYDGKICVSNVTDFQAKSILMLANKSMEERVKIPNGSEEKTFVQSPHQLYSPPSSVFSMKRSLQRFLQKRKTRVQEASPYNH